MLNTTSHNVRYAAELEELLWAEGFGGEEASDITAPIPGAGRYAAAYSVNFRRGPRGELVKRCGTKTAFECGEDIRALYYGQTAALPGGRWYYVAGSRLYRCDTGGGGTAEIGDIGSVSGECSVFPFGGRIYVISAGGYYVTDGTSLSGVSGYVPTVTCASAGDGAKTECESENILTRDVIERFTLSVGSQNFYLSHDVKIGTYITVCLDGQTVSGWTLMRVSPRMYVSAPSAVSPGHTVEIRYTAAGDDPPLKAELLSCRRAAVWGGKNDESLILWGGSGVFFVSECRGGINPSADYFTASGRVEIGTGDRPTAFVHHGSNSMVFTGSSCRMLSQRTVRRGRASGCGWLERSWSMSELSGAAGAYCVSGAAEVGSAVFSEDAAGVWAWRAGYIAGERNAEMIGSPDTTPALDRELLKNCHTVRDREHGELWLASETGDTAVWNVRMKTWYRLKIPAFDRIYDTPLGPALVIGGRTLVFDPVCGTDAGDTPISAAFCGVWSDCGWGGGIKTARLLSADLGPYTDGCTIRVEAVRAGGDTASCEAELENGTPLPKRAECALSLGRAVYIRVCVESEAGECRIDRLFVMGVPLAKTSPSAGRKRRKIG